jgi:hypothetical protein
MAVLLSLWAFMAFSTENIPFPFTIPFLLQIMAKFQVLFGPPTYGVIVSVISFLYAGGKMAL